MDEWEVQGTAKEKQMTILNIALEAFTKYDYKKESTDLIEKGKTLSIKKTNGGI